MQDWTITHRHTESLRWTLEVETLTDEGREMITLNDAMDTDKRKQVS